LFLEILAAVRNYIVNITQVSHFIYYLRNLHAKIYTIGILIFLPILSNVLIV